MNHNLIKEKFSSKLKNANVTPAYNKDDPTNKVNFWLVCFLLSYSKVFERIYDQLDIHGCIPQQIIMWI